VIWGRMSKTKNWRYPLFALHMLRSLLLHGPITVVSEASEGGNLVRSFTHFKAKNGEGAKEVRHVAEMVYQLLCDKPRLFAQRRHVAGRRLSKAGAKKQENNVSPWSTYLVHKLPVSAKFADVHVILEPKTVMRSQAFASPEPHDERRESSNLVDDDDPPPMDDNDSLDGREGIGGMLEVEQQEHLLNAIGEETSQDLRLMNSTINRETTPQPKAQAKIEEEDPLFDDRSSFSSTEDDSEKDDEYCDDDNYDSDSGGDCDTESDDVNEDAR
jgi:hypothetical protein